MECRASPPGISRSRAFSFHRRPPVAYSLSVTTSHISDADVGTGLPACPSRARLGRLLAGFCGSFE
jgi:hypothetical protein